MSGKSLRLKRFLSPADGRAVILPLDHGVSCGPIPGLEQLNQVVRMGIRGGANALVLHKGMLRCLEPVTERMPGVFMHLSASTQMGPDFHRKVLTGTVEEAIRRGADGVSVHVNLGDAHEPEMLADLGRVGSACAEWGLPLLVMIYVRGANAPCPVPDSAVAHAARVAAELGADIIKIPAPQHAAALARIAADLPVPVVVAGGSKAADILQFLERIETSLQTGVRGVAIGRNVFQHERPEALLKAICRIVHRGVGAREAWNELELHGEQAAKSKEAGSGQDENEG